MPRKTNKTKSGRVSMQDLMSLVNKKAGRNVAHDLTTENPTEVKQWIPTVIVTGKLYQTLFYLFF